MADLIETIQGDYGAFSKLVPGTRKHVDELWKDRLIVPKVRDRWFYTADGAIYFLSKDGKSHDPTGRPYFALTREGSNPLLKNLDEAYKQILQTWNYRVPDKDLESALADPATEVFGLDELSLTNYFNLYSSLEIPIAQSRQHLNCDQKRLMERVYGKDDDLEKIMVMLAEKKMSATRTYLLNSNYVRIHASAGVIGRASWLDCFSGNFCALCSLVDGHSALRGVVSSERSESNISEECQKNLGRLSLFKGMDGGELSVINSSVGGLTVAEEEVPERKISFFKKITGKLNK